MNRRLVIVVSLVLIIGVSTLLLVRWNSQGEQRVGHDRASDAPFVETQETTATTANTLTRQFFLKEASVLSCGVVSIGWQSINESGVEYDVLRFDEQSGELKRVAVVRQDDVSSCGSSFCSYTDKTILPRVEYSYSIRARGTDWTRMNASSGCVLVDQQPCPVSVRSSACEMESIRVSNDVCSSVNLDWNSLLETSSYRVYRKTGDQQEFVNIAEVNSPRFEDRDVVADQEYEYSVSPVYVWGEEGKRSKLISITTSCPERKWEER